MPSGPRRRLAVLAIACIVLAGCAGGDAATEAEPGAAAQAAAAAADAADAGLSESSSSDGVSDGDPSSGGIAREDSAGEDPAQEDPALGEADAEEGVGKPEPGAAASSRIVVETDDGQLYLIDADGGNRTDLSDVDQALARHPVWSPDGRRIGWSEVTESGAAIVSADADGGQRRRAQSNFSGYFGYWNPTSTLLGFLGNNGSGTGMLLDDGTGSRLGETVDSDSFYYYSWSPDGDRWVVHSGSGIRIMSADGSPGTLVDLEPGRFRAPVWTPDGSILLAIPDADGNVIVRLNPETGAVQPVLAVGDITSIVLDPTGRYLAIESVYVELDEDSDDTGDGADAGTSTISQPTGDPRLERAEVLVHDLQSGETVVAWENISAGFWWSPDGTTLAILVGAEQPTLARWFVWRGEASFVGEPFRLTRNFATGYVPFFDQFAQAVSPWSPDSSQFVYTGTNAAGEQGVYVQQAEPDTAAELIADGGVIAFWSPT